MSVPVLSIPDQNSDSVVDLNEAKDGVEVF